MARTNKDGEKYIKFTTSFEKTTNKMSDWPEWKKNISLLDNINISETVVVKKTTSNSEDSDK